MGSLNDDYAILLAGAARLDVDMARSLLDGAGIPCLADAPDAMSAQDSLKGPFGNPFADLYVPKPALESAMEVLAQAWGSEWQLRMSAGPRSD